jgi:riboflavin biosynthesis pyrimidine reductase
VDVAKLPLDDRGGFDPHDVVRTLAARGWRRVLVEGGGVTVSRFLAAEALDRLHVSVAALILGSGRPAFTLPTIRTLDEGLRPPVRHFRLGTDLLFDLDLGR